MRLFNTWLLLYGIRCHQFVQQVLLFLSLHSQVRTQRLLQSLLAGSCGEAPTIHSSLAAMTALKTSNQCHELGAWWWHTIRSQGRPSNWATRKIASADIIVNVIERGTSMPVYSLNVSLPLNSELIRCSLVVFYHRCRQLGATANVILSRWLNGLRHSTRSRRLLARD